MVATDDPESNAPPPPVVIDGTGLSSTVPLLIKNGKPGSGVEVQVTGTARSGFVINNSSGTAITAFGLAVSANDWFTSTVAGDVVLAIPSGKSIRLGVLGGTVTNFAFNATLGRFVVSDANASTQIVSLDSGTPQCKFIETNQNGRSISIQAYNGSTTILGLTASNIMEIVASSTSGGLCIYTAGSQSLIFGSNGAERVQLDSAGNVTIGTAALSTSATDGFLYIPTCAGAPSGTPTSKTGRGPLIYDSTNNKLYFYNGAWKGVTLA